MARAPRPATVSAADDDAPISLFISYRRSDSAGHVGRLYDRFMAIRSFREGGIFHDIDSIQVGADFVSAMRAAIGFADVVLVVIGADWLTAANVKGRRLDDPEDSVRIEVTEALAAGVAMVPVLVREAHMPKAEDLPPPLAPLVTRNAIDISDSRFDHDVERLVDAIRKAAASSRHAHGPRPEKPAAGPYYEMGMEYVRQSDFVNAKRCMLAAIAAQPDSTQTHMGLSQALQGEAQKHIELMNYGIAADLLAEGEQAAIQALQANDTDPDVLAQLGYLRKDVAQNHRAIKNERAAREALARARASFEMALGHDPRNASALNGLANVAALEGDLERAIALGRRVARLDPKYTYALFDLATSYADHAHRTKGTARRASIRALLATCRRLVELEADAEAAALPAESRDYVRQLAAWAKAEGERTRRPRRKKAR